MPFTPERATPERLRHAVRDRGPADTFARFMMFVQIGEEPEDCWAWRGTKVRGQYGQFSLGSKTVKAHRWIYETVVGPIPAGLVIRHRCDNPQCVNPRHLETGTVADNTRDKFERGRAPDRSGSKHPLARLTEAQVLEIRRRASCGATHAELAAAYGVRRGQIGKIVNRINWRHI
jgi:hypothetical protein